MKNFFITLLILIILGGVVFYFGWVQFQIPPDSVGVLFTKTGGFEETPVMPGTFVWRWERLLPTNMTIYTFPLKKQQTEITVSGSLPSADLYATVLPGEPDFNYTVTVSLLYSIDPADLPRLLEKQLPGSDLLPQLVTVLEESGSAVLTKYMYRAVTENRHILDFGEDIESYFVKEFPYLTFHAVNPIILDLPDIGLYREAKTQYVSLMRQQNDILQRETAQAATIKKISEERLDVLRQYGALLTDFPIILDYLALRLDQDFLFQSLGLETGE